MSILITGVGYLYLFYYIRSKSKIIKDSRQSGINYNKKLVFTISYIFISLLIFTIPQFISLLVRFTTNIDKHAIASRNIIHWQIILLNSNSYANALILIYNTKAKRNYSSSHKAQSSDQLTKVSPL